MAVKFQQLSAWSTGPGVSQPRSGDRNQTDSGPFEGVRTIHESVCYNKYGLSGDKNSALLFGGAANELCACALDATEEYDGATWATSNAMTHCGIYTSGVGSQNATLATSFGSKRLSSLIIDTSCDNTSESDFVNVVNNHCSPAAVTTSRFQGDASLEYNGTSWDTTATDIAAADGTRCQNINGGIVGEMTNALVFGGGNYCIVSPSALSNDGEGYIETTQDRLYNGTSWSVTGNTLNSNRMTGQSVGNAESALYAGGHRTTGRGTLFQAGNGMSCVEEYNGTSWSEVNNLITPRQDGGGAGTQNDGVIFGGHNIRFSTACGGNGDDDPDINTSGYPTSTAMAQSTYYGLYTQHYDGVAWKNASGLMNNHRWGITGTGGTQGSALGGVGMGRTHTPNQSPSENWTEDAIRDGSGRGHTQPTTNVWYNEFSDYCVGEGPSSYSAKAVSYINTVEEYNVTTGGAQFGPRISGFQLSSMWDVGNYKSLFSRDKGNNCSDGIVGKLATNDFYADTSLSSSYSGSAEGTDYGMKASEGTDRWSGAGLYGTGYVSGSVQFQGWTVGPDLNHFVTSNTTSRGNQSKANGLMGAGKQDSMIVMGGHTMHTDSEYGNHEGDILARTTIYDGTNYSEGPMMHRAISHGAAAGKDSENVIIVGSGFTSLKGAFAPGGMGVSNQSVCYDGQYDRVHINHFRGRESDAENATYLNCIAAGCHGGHATGDVNLSAPALNDWTGDKGGYTTSFRNPGTTSLPDACISMTNQTSHLDGTTWSDGGALPVGVYSEFRNPRITGADGDNESAPYGDPGLAGGKDFLAGAIDYDCKCDSHSFIGARFTVGGPSNALFICDSNGQKESLVGETNGNYEYLASPYLRQDKAVNYDGSTWSAVNSPLHSGLFQGNAMAGNPESAIRVTGQTIASPHTPSSDINSCKTEEYDGYVWSQLPNQLIGRNYAGWTSNDSLSGQIWGGSGKAVMGADNYARSDSWDGNAWISSCAVVQHVPRCVVAEDTQDVCSISEGIASPSEGPFKRAQQTRAGLGTKTGTDDRFVSPSTTTCGYGESIFLDGVGTTNSAYASTGFVKPTWMTCRTTTSEGGTPVGDFVTARSIQTAFWNDVSVRDIKNNLHFNVSGSSFQPKSAILDCTALTGDDTPNVAGGSMTDCHTTSVATTYGTSYAANFNDARINTSAQDKNHYIELDGSGSMESDYYLSSDSSFHYNGGTGFENCTYSRVWSIENGLSQPRLMMDGAGTPEGAIVAGGQSCSPSNASVSTFNNAELWDGVQFSAAPSNLPASTRRHVTLGSKNHAHVFGGYCPGSNPASTNLQDNIQQYLNGTWSNLSATLSTPRADAMGAGAAGGWVLWGGTTVGCTNNAYGDNLTNDVVIYNGDTIIAGTATPTVVGHQAAVGSSNAAMGVGGVIANDSNINAPGDTTDTTIKFDGSSWSAGPNQLISTHFQAGAGTQNAGTFWGGQDYSGGATPTTSIVSNSAGTKAKETQEFDGTSFSQGGRIPQTSACSIGGVSQASNTNWSSDGFGNIGNNAMAIGQSFNAIGASFIYGEYKGKKVENRISADKTSGGLTISMWVRMPRTADSYDDASAAWNNKLYLAANADVDVASRLIEATTDVPRSGVRLLRYYNGTGDQIRLEWANRAESGLGSGNYSWDANGNQDITSYFQTTDNQTFAVTDWYNIVAVVSFERSATTNKIFINGTKKSITLSGQTATTYEDVRYPGNYTSKFRIGRFAGHKYQLDVANVMYYTRQLGDDEVIQNYKTLLPRFI